MGSGNAERPAGREPAGRSDAFDQKGADTYETCDTYKPSGLPVPGSLAQAMHSASI